MSFSSDIKRELNKNSNLANKEMVKNELIGYLVSGNTNAINSKEIKFSTESDYNINRFSKLLSNLEINHKIDISRKIFSNFSKNKRCRIYYHKGKSNLCKDRRKSKRRIFKSYYSWNFYGIRFY